MAESSTCRDCGVSFTPNPDLLARFPGWTPRTCTDCYRAARGGGGARPSGRSRERSRGEGPRPQSLDAARSLPASGPDEGLFTDGGASPNPGPGGWGAVYVRDGDVVAEDHGHETATTTNNRMELTAIARGIELVPPGTACTVWSDSNLSVRTLTEWAAGWERRGWTRKTGAVENLDLVRPLYERLRERPELELRWIKAHAGHRWNEYADALATAWMRDRP